MGNYGLKGMEYPEMKMHRYCPSIRRNCCSGEDIARSMDLWITNDRDFIRKYYDTYLTSVLYLMGWVEESGKLALEFESSGTKDFSSHNSNVRLLKNEQNNHGEEIRKILDPLSSDAGPDFSKSEQDVCNYASAQMMSLRANKSTMKADYSAIKSYITKMIELRSGFYCNLCDADSQEKIDKMWKHSSTEEDSTPNVFIFGRQFCNEFLINSITIVKYVLDTFRKYLNSLALLLVCKKNSLEKKGATSEFNAANKKLKFETAPIYKVGRDEYSTFTRCDRLGRTSDAHACQDYCTMFDLTAPNPFIDGDIKQMRNFVMFVQKNKNLFIDNENTVMFEDVGVIENKLNMTWNNIFTKANFFASNDQFGVMDRFNTLIVLGDGANPFGVSTGNSYAVNLKRAGRFGVACLLALALLSLFWF